MKIVICGGGISGLSAAFYAGTLLSRFSKDSFKIIVLEKSPQVGGWLKTNVDNGSRKGYDGPINELGPRSIRAANNVIGNNTLQLVSDLGFEDHVIPVTARDVAPKTRLIYANKKLHTLPSSPFEFLRKTSPFSRSLARYFLPSFLAKVPDEYETMNEILSARCGPEVADYLVSSFCRGVFAADSQQLSMKAAFPALWKMFKPKRSCMPRRPAVDRPDLLNQAFMKDEFVKRASKEKWKQWAVDDGFQYFTSRIADQLTQKFDVEILHGTELEAISILDDNRAQLTLHSTGFNLHKNNFINGVDHVMFALPSFSLSKILRRSRGSDEAQDEKLSSLASSLNQIRWVDVAVANVEYNFAPGVLLPKFGFGHLVPSSEPSKVLGIVYDSCSFPQHDRLGHPTTRLTCMMGGSWFPELFGNPDKVSNDTLTDAALESIGQQLHITHDPLTMQTTLCKKCIPMYGVGHTDMVEDMEDTIEQYNLPFSLIGASYWGVSINDCIFNSRIATYDMLMKQGLELRNFPS